MGCIAWTPAQLALMQTYLDDKLVYREAAQKFNTETGAAITKSVIAGLVSRGYLRHEYTGLPYKRGRVPIAAMQHRLALLRDAHQSGLDNITAIAERAGLTYEQARRGLERLKLKVVARPRTYNNAGVNLNKKRRNRSSERRKPYQYTDDPVAAIGVHFLDKRANHCNYIVAKDPDDGLARFCDGHRMMHGPFFASPYCGEHHIRCHRIEYLEAAE